MMVISILRNLADAPARVATANPTAPAGTSSSNGASVAAAPHQVVPNPPQRPIVTIDANAHPAAPVVPVGESAAAAPVVPVVAHGKAPSLAAFGSSLL